MELVDLLMKADAWEDLCVPEGKCSIKVCSSLHSTSSGNGGSDAGIPFIFEITVEVLTHVHVEFGMFGINPSEGLACIMELNEKCKDLIWGGFV